MREALRDRDVGAVAGAQFLGERFDDAWIELRACAALELRERLLFGPRPAVAARRGHRVVGVGHEHDPCREGDLLPGELARVAGNQAVSDTGSSLSSMNNDPMFKKYKRTMQHYRTEAANLDPQAFSFVLAMTSSAETSGRMQRLSRRDPQLAVALFLLDYERQTGSPPSAFTAAVDDVRTSAREEGIPEDELEAFVWFHFRHYLAESGVQL